MKKTAKPALARPIPRYQPDAPARAPKSGKKTGSRLNTYKD